MERKRYPETHDAVGRCKCGARSYEEHLKNGHGHTYSGR